MIEMMREYYHDCFCCFQVEFILFLMFVHRSNAFGYALCSCYTNGAFIEELAYHFLMLGGGYRSKSSILELRSLALSFIIGPQM